jgi:hypothetical protein
MAGKVADQFCESAFKSAALNSASANFYGTAWDLGFTGRDKIALVINKIRATYSAFEAIAAMDTSCVFGFVLGGRDLTGLTPGYATVEQPHNYVMHQQVRNMTTSGVILEQTADIDLTGLPGGGFICPVRPLFINTWATNIAAPELLELHLMFQTMELDQASLLDLVQVMLGYGWSS